MATDKVSYLLGRWIDSFICELYEAEYDQMATMPTDNSPCYRGV